MCLYVNRNVHKGDSPNPLVAKKPILVYKVLGERLDGGRFTPYRRQDLKFKDGKAEMRIQIDDLKAYATPFIEEARFAVEEGIHAFCVGSVAADEVVWQDRWACFGNEYRIFLSVIPKGHKYFVGDAGDIVATKLIIFETAEGLSDYEKKKKTDAVTVDEVVPGI